MYDSIRVKKAGGEDYWFWNQKTEILNSGMENTFMKIPPPHHLFFFFLFPHHVLMYSVITALKIKLENVNLFDTIRHKNSKILFFFLMQTRTHNELSKWLIICSVSPTFPPFLYFFLLLWYTPFHQKAWNYL